MMSDPAFIVALAFVVFVLLAGKKIAKLLAGGLDNRSDAIKKELDEAVKLKEEALALLASYQRKHKKAKEDAEDILANAEEEAQRIIKTAQKKVEEELARREAIAMQKIAQAEANAVQGIRENAVDITISVARQLIVENMTPDAAQALLNKSIAEIRSLH